MPMEADKQDSTTEPNPLQNVFVRFHTPEGDCMDEKQEHGMASEYTCWWYTTLPVSSVPDRDISFRVT